MQIFQLSYYWARNMYTEDEKEFQTGICRDTLVDWGNFFRDVTIEWYTKNEIVIG